MKVRCINNQIDHPSSAQAFELNELYTVYAMAIFEDAVWYCICDKFFTCYPLWKRSVSFEVADNRLSRYWVFSQKSSGNASSPAVIYSTWAFPEWAEEESFYYNLLEFSQKEIDLFMTYKALMDLEFPDPNITEMAQIGDSEWLICPICIDAWSHASDRDAMVRCPKCLKTLQNPRYPWDRESATGKVTSFLTIQS